MKERLLILLVLISPTKLSTAKLKLEEGKEDLLIAKMLHHEACNDTEMNRIALTHLVYNRVLKGKSKGYEDTVESVLNQKGQWNGFNKWKDPCNKCLYSVYKAKFHCPISDEVTHYLSKWDTNKKHIKKITVLYEYGGHKFGSYAD